MIAVSMCMNFYITALNGNLIGVIPTIIRCKIMNIYLKVKHPGVPLNYDLSKYQQ